MASTLEGPEKAAFEILVSKYQSDPEWFERHLPEIGEIVRQTVSTSDSPDSTFKLSEQERYEHLSSLHALDSGGKLDSHQAIDALEHCAVLIRDGSLPDEINHEVLVSLFKAAVGKSSDTFREKTTVGIEGRDGIEPTNQQSLIRGVALNLDVSMKLVSITIDPSKHRERKKLMSFVGIGSDAATDVSFRHDDYLAEQSPHGAA